MTTKTQDESSKKLKSEDMKIKDHENMSTPDDLNFPMIRNNRTEKKSCYRWFILVQFSS